ncbi:MAG: hypothetical protein WCE51_01095 [Chthoniobacterales bacterium]
MKPLSIVIPVRSVRECMENTPPVEEVRGHFERGISGQGRVVPSDDLADSVLPLTSHRQ